MCARRFLPQFIVLIARPDTDNRDGGGKKGGPKTKKKAIIGRGKFFGRTLLTGALYPEGAHSMT